MLTASVYWRQVDVAGVLHGGEDLVAAPQGLVGLLERVVDRGRLGQPGDQRSLDEREVLRVPREVRLRSRLRPVRMAAEVDLVQVGLENPLLAPALELGAADGRLGAPEQRQAHLLELDRQAGLLRLALPGDLVADVEVADELLRERGAALDDLAALEVLDRRAHDALVVDAGVRVEAPVLDRHGCLREERGHLVERDRLAVLLRGDGPEHGVVGRVDERVLADRHRPQRLERAAVPEGLRAGERGGHEDCGPAQEDREQRDEDEAARLRPVSAAAAAAAAALAVVDYGRAVAVAVPVAAVLAVLAVASVRGHA